MSTPSVNIIGQGLSFEWPGFHLRITLDRFRDGQHPTAEYHATTTAPGYQPHISQGKLTLTSTDARGKESKRLKALYPEAKWDEIMETICALGLRHMRQGEPVLRLTASADIPPPIHRLFPLVYDGLPTVLFGPGGVGKSYLALFMAMLVDHGGWDAGFCGQPGPSLYIDYESDYADLASRAKRIRGGHGKLTGVEPLYRRCYVPFADDLPALQHCVAESGVKFLVIDSLAAACGAELERAETAIRFFNALRSLRVASLILAHVAKNSEEKSIYGSVFFSNFARSTWEMKKAQEAGDHTTRIGLYHRKTNIGPLQQPLGLKLHFGEVFSLEPIDLNDEPSLAVSLPLASRLKAALKGGAKSAKELSEELGVELPQVKARLSDGLMKWSTKIGDAKWGLLEVSR